MYLNEANEDDEGDSNPLDHFWLEGDSLAPPCQADLEVVRTILDMAAPFLAPIGKPSSEKLNVLYDLGCGDGRICIEATRRFGCNSTGCEIEPHLVAQFKTNIASLGLDDSVSVIEGDLRELPLDTTLPVGVIVCYLLPESVAIIQETLLRAMERGSVLIFNTWGLKGITPVQTRTCGAGTSSLLESSMVEAQDHHRLYYPCGCCTRCL